MKQQMNMAFMEEGGLKDDGMDKDPVSGNDIPAGSMAKEVRDDIPAQLSEGEYVVPADVVQYYGVKFFEDLRMKAKMGLAQMDRDGRIGGEPVAVAAIAIDSGEEQLDSEDEKKIMEMLGEPVKADEGVLTDSDYHQAAKTSLNTDPTANFQYLGQNTMKQGTPSLAKQETWYHPDGRKQKVSFDASGVVTPATDMQFTQAPWSRNPPSKTEQSSNITQKKDKPPIQLIPAVGKAGTITNDNGDIVRMTSGNYDAIAKSFTALKGKGGINKISDYYKLDMPTRIALIGAETGTNVSSEEVQKIIDNAGDANFMKSMEIVFGSSPFAKIIGGILNVGKGLLTSILKPIFNLTETSPETQAVFTKVVADSSSDESSGKKDRPSTSTFSSRDYTPSSVANVSGKGSTKDTAKAGISTISSSKAITDEAAANLREQNMNKGGLLTKPKRKPKKPRGKGLASK